MKLLKRFDLLFIGLFAFLCWGRILAMPGMWGDDWAWVWQYFSSNNMKEFLVPFVWIKHLIVGILIYGDLKLFSFSYEYVSYFWRIQHLALLLVNAFLLYSIIGRILKNSGLLRYMIPIFYLSSPVVNNLCFVMINYHGFVSLYLLSILFSIKSIEGGGIRWGYYALALLFAFVPMTSLESFIFMEILRPLICHKIIIMSNDPLRSKISYKKILFFWVPFLMMGGLIILDSVIRPQSGSYADLYATREISVEYILLILKRYYISLKYTFITIYIDVFKMVYKKPDALLITISFVSAIIGALTFHNFLNKGKYDSLSNSNKEVGNVFLFGILAVLAGIFAYAVTREHFEYGLASRHALLASVGSAICIPSFICLFYNMGIIKKSLATISAGVLVFLGVLGNNYEIKTYKENWEHQRQIMWQLIWRAPDIKPNTFMLIDMPWAESPGGGSYVLPAAINLAYAKSNSKDDLNNKYAVELLNALRADEMNFRSLADKDEHEFMIYKGMIKIYLRNLIAASYKDGYLYLDDEIDTPVRGTKEDMDFMVSRASHERIIYSPPDDIKFPLRGVFGPEPEHDWRYYYQRSNALFGAADYKAVMGLYAEAGTKGYDLKTIMPENLLPFAAASYATMDFERGADLLKAWADKGFGNRNRATAALKMVSGDAEIYKIMEKDIKYLVPVKAR